MELENLIKTAIEEALPEFGIDELCALLAARIEAKYVLRERGGKVDSGRYGPRINPPSES
jgi:hypothetical protein